MVIESSDLSNNNLTGDVPTNGSLSYFTLIKLVQLKFLCFHKHIETTTLLLLVYYDIIRDEISKFYSPTYLSLQF